VARTPRNSKPFPTRDAVLTFIRESTTPVGKREIARAFQITGSDRIPLKAMLRELKAEGLFYGGKSRYASERGRVPNVCVLEVTDIDGDGELIARPVRWESDTAPPPIYLSPQAPGIGALGVGDRVLARTKKTAAGFEAETIRVLEGGRQQVIGVFSLDADGGRIEPTDRRAKRDFRVSREYTKGAKPGEIVVAETVAGRHLGLPEARIVERIGKSDEPASISLLAIHSHGIPTTFPEDALAEAAAAAPPSLGKRVDLRAVPLVTIDGADARDFDDAVFAEPDSDKKNSGGWHLIVAIADVAHFVRPGSPLDNEAVERGNSTYFPDRVVPMLPEALSNGLCSLKPNEDRACLAAHLYIDSAGTLVRHRFERALMRSTARLTYGQVQQARDGAADDETAPIVDTIIAPLYAAYHALADHRRQREALDIDLPERQISIDDSGAITGISAAPRYDSHRLIEEFMIAANVAAAETLEKRQAACMYRIHDQPDMAKLEGLREFLKDLGFKLVRIGRMKPAMFNQILRKAENGPQSHLINIMVLRSQARAEYNPRNIGHFGLSLQRYAHFTSPIRRYADLLVHRSLIQCLKLGTDGLTKQEEAAMAELGVAISKTERRSQVAERDAKDRYCTAFLAEHVGASFSGRVSGVTRFGAFVELDETGADGLIPGAMLSRERPRYDATRHQLTVGNARVRLGDQVIVELVEASTVTGGLLLSLKEVNGKHWPHSPAARSSTGRGGKPDKNNKPSHKKGHKAGGGRRRRR